MPECWLPGGDTEERKQKRYRVSFNPSSYLVALEQLLISEGVDILYDTRVCNVVKKGDLVTHLIIENKDGRTAVSCQGVIDATGDADICFMAGKKQKA